MAQSKSEDPKTGEKIYESLREEPTRFFPRPAFVSATADLLPMVGAYGAEPLGRELTPLEQEIREDLLAIVFVRLPQIPSGRAFGREPVGGVVDYFLRAPGDHSKWQTYPNPPRAFPPVH
jgi:hypothetical protein